MIALASAGPSFRHSISAEFITGSAIAPSLFESAIAFTEDTGRWEVHQLLGWEVSTNWQTRKPHNFGVFAGLYQETGELWQGKPEHFPDWLDGKYLGPKQGARAYLPPVSAPIRELLELPLEGSAWEAIAADPTIPIVLTEGGKKGLCGLSNGYAAIAGFGVDAFSRKGEGQLLSELLPFVNPQRRWRIAFDEDFKPKTRLKVRQATARVAQLLIDAGVPAENISVAQWLPSQGKGLDDLVVQSGTAALHDAIAQAVPFTEWKRGGFDAFLQGKYPELFGLTHDPIATLEQRYLPALGLPSNGGILAISSPMGTGKTEAMQGLIKQARAIDGECLVELIGYRNSLGKQSAQRLKLDHIHDLQGDSYAQTFVDSASGLAYCLDSLHRRFKAVLAALDRGQRVLLLLDEVDAVLKHLFLGSTLGQRRGEIALMLCELLQAIASGGGWIVAGEADLQSLPLNFLEHITGQPVQLIINQWQGQPWQIEAPMPINQKGQPSAALMGKAAQRRVLEILERGERVAVASDSQRWGEVLDRLAIERGYSVRRLDGQTSEEPWAHQLMQAPDAFLSEDKPQLFIYSPTAESGLSITGSHFDQMVVYGSHLEHRAIAQLMGRIRSNIPRVVYCREFSLSDESGRAMDPKALLKDWELNARYSSMMAQLGDQSPELELDGIEATLHEFAALYQCRSNYSQAQLRKSLLASLEAQGHSIRYSTELPLSELFRDSISAIQDDLKIEAAEQRAAADISDMSITKAHSILSGSASQRDDRIKAEKRLLLENYPGLPVDDADFILNNIIEGQGRGLRQHTALFLAQNPKVAQVMDRLSWASQIESKIIWLPSIKHEAPKAKLIELSGLLELLELPTYQETSAAVQRVKSFALSYQADIKRLLGLWCTEHHTGIQIVNKLAKRLGMKPAILEKIGPRGAQVKVWHWSNREDSDRSAIFAALTERWSDVLESSELEAFKPVASISDRRQSLTEIEATTTGKASSPSNNWGSRGSLTPSGRGNEATSQAIPLRHDYPPQQKAV